MRAWLTAAAAAAGMAASAQDAPKTGVPGDVATEAIRRGDYMTAHRVLETAMAAGDRGDGGFYTTQMWQQITPMLTGEITPEQYARGRVVAAPDPADTARVRAAVARPAIAEIVRRARLTTIVILNEAHFSPRDRAFALQVARALRPLGYGYLAVETINGGPQPGSSPALDRLVADRAVTRGTGFYTQDPVFAGYLNQALRLGYRPVQYESTVAQNARGPGVQPREDGQAENLRSFLRAHPGARLLVHVGHGHVNEVPQRRADGAPVALMAARLKQLTGIDPLTINQTTMSDLQPAMRDAYPIAAAKAAGRSVVLFENGRPLLLGTPATDLQVVHPARAYRHGRPTWLAALGGRPVAIPAALLPSSGERLIQAFDAAAPADAVPLDQVLVTAGRSPPSLMLPPRVRIRYATQP